VIIMSKSINNRGPIYDIDGLYRRVVGFVAPADHWAGLTPEAQYHVLCILVDASSRNPVLYRDPKARDVAHDASLLAENTVGLRLELRIVAAFAFLDEDAARGSEVRRLMSALGVDERSQWTFDDAAAVLSDWPNEVSIASVRAYIRARLAGEPHPAACAALGLASRSMEHVSSLLDFAGAKRDADFDEVVTWANDAHAWVAFCMRTGLTGERAAQQYAAEFGYRSPAIDTLAAGRSLVPVLGAHMGWSRDTAHRWLTEAAQVVREVEGGAF
jgi:hypothetical protein